MLSCAYPLHQVINLNNTFVSTTIHIPQQNCFENSAGLFRNVSVLLGRLLPD